MNILALPLAAISDSDFVKVVEKIGNILERLSALETEVKNHAVLAGVILAILGFFGWRQVKSWIVDYVKKQGDKVSTKVDADLRALISAREQTLTKTEANLTAFITQAAEGAAQVRAIVEQARLAGLSGILWESGELQIDFRAVNYVNFWVNFKTKFPVIPQVFVAESLPGEWVYAKIDERHPDRFLFASRSLSGLPITHTTRIQWFAVCEKPAMARPAGDFERIGKLIESEEATAAADRKAAEEKK